jgi:type VI secretion system secreted protein VgrG
MARPPRNQDEDELSQDNRLGVLSTPLDLDTRRGRDALVLVRFEGNEGLSELFEYRIEALSNLENIDFNKALGQQCTVTIETFGGQKRDFHGILVEAQRLGPREDRFAYRLVLRPWLWLLTRTTDCRIFLDKTAPEIIKEVFTDRKFVDFQSRIENEGSFPKLEYCVQFRETDFNFVARLMEKEGIYYYFTHQNGKHTLVLANSRTSHDPVLTLQERDIIRDKTLELKEDMPFLPSVGKFVPTTQRIENWITERKFRSGVVELKDYNYETPNAQMACIEIGDNAYEHGDMEIFEHPGDFNNADQGQRYAEIYLEAEQARDHRRKAIGEAVSLFPGGFTKLTKGPVARGTDRFLPESEFQEYLVVRASHAYGDQSYRSGGRGRSSNGVYRGNYEFLPRDQPFRAPIATPKPRIYGIQTAVVVDKQGHGRVDKSTEEIEVEKLSEIYVSFFWDRRQHKEKRSVKLRCAQLWAGKKWGAQFIPRIGMEVVVEFLDGDPDRPIVTGCVYNENNQPPYDLPAEKTKAGIKSESTKGDHGFNEWNFEDKKDHEQINVHAQKDLNVTVLNNETRSVGANMVTTVGNSETRTIGKNFKPPTGSPSRKTTIENGDDQLDVKNGAILTTAKVKMEFTVGPSKLTIDPTGITLEAPTITIKAQTTCIIQGLPVKIN